MKKLFALILALVMMTALTVPALAATETSENLDPATISVKGIYKLATSGDTAYFVDITWENMTFTYTAKAKWNGSEYVEDSSAAGTWEGTGTVAVTNRSNAVVSVSMAFDGIEENESDSDRIIGDITGTLTGGGAQNVNKEASVNAELTINGGKLSAGAEEVNIGTITVTLGPELV